MTTATKQARPLTREQLEAERSRLLIHLDELGEDVEQKPQQIADALEKHYRGAVKTTGEARSLRRKQLAALEEVEATKSELQIVDKLIGEHLVAEREAELVRLRAEMVDYIQAEEDALTAFGEKFDELPALGAAYLQAVERLKAFWGNHKDVFNEGSDAPPHVLDPPQPFSTLVANATVAAVVGPNAAYNPLARWVTFVYAEAQPLPKGMEVGIA